MALTRIVELEEGKIEIDGQDISQVDLKALRDQITMIPQDPTLFTGPLRFNLDPFDKHTDERILDLIKKAGLEYMLEGTSKKELEDKKKKEEEEKKKKENPVAEGDSDSDSDDDEKKKDEKEKSKDEESKDGDKDKESKDGEKDKKKKDKDEKEDEDDGKGLNFKIEEEGKNLSVGER